MADTTPCKALESFSEFVFGYGVVHGDPDSTDKTAKTPAVPNHVIDHLVGRGVIASPKGRASAVDAPAEEAPAA